MKPPKVKTKKSWVLTRPYVGTLYVLGCILMFLAQSQESYAQCNTTGFTVTKTTGTCFSNATLTVKVPTSTNCSGWVAEIVKTPGGTPIQLSVQAGGGDVTFTS